MWLDVPQEAANGNRRPAVTVGTYHQIKETTVRKAVQRVTARLSHLAATDDTYTSLLVLPCIRPAAAA